MLTRENFAKNSTVAADSSVGGRNSSSETINSMSDNNEQLLVTMVDNNTTSSSGGESVGSGVTITTIAPNIDNHNKLILKLPKTTADQEVATSSSAVQSDTRKVEPLKINLLQHTNNNNSSPQTVPKITIKPIFAQANSDTAVSSDCSSSTEEEAPQRDSSVDSSSPNSPNEPHIVPKLTIRSAEEGGTAHSSIVPKLTIKMNESTSSSNNLITNSANNNSVLPPPLPKLTIKTMLDGSSGARISSLSPASSSSSSYCSAASSSSGNATISSAVVTTSGAANIVPKLTIKTNASGACVSSSEEQQESKLPKLTIKTGQEHAMIITQHSNDTSSVQSIPKMTIKTKTLRVEDEAAELRDEEQMGKIPKLMLKTNEDIGPLSPLVVRNMPQNESLDRVPKLMISRQQDSNLMTANNHFDAKINLKSNHCLDEGLKVIKKNNCTIDEQEKVPKLTIKHLNIVTEESHETTMNKSIPKLTIKNLSSPKLKIKAVLDEDNNVNCNELPNNNNNNNNNNINNKTSTSTDNQRDSDDMDIDEALQAHDPKIFNNVSTLFNDFSKSAACVGNSLLTTAVRRVVDTVDLTSSPDRSPAHTTQTPTMETPTIKATATPLLLERLQRDTSVIQSTMGGISNQLDNSNTNTSFLLNQLNAPLAMPNLKRHSALPLALNNRLFQQQLAPQQLNKNLKYPNLTERLMANGMHTINALVTEPTNVLVASGEVLSKTNENVIDSIEILDTPDGSSQSSLDENASLESVNEPLHQFKNGIYLKQQSVSPKKCTPSDPLHCTNDVGHQKLNNSSVENFADVSRLKRKTIDNYKNR